jgi:hypothetical protein
MGTAFDAAEINLPRVQIHLYIGKGPVSVEGLWKVWGVTGYIY